MSNKIKNAILLFLIFVFSLLNPYSIYGLEDKREGKPNSAEVVQVSESEVDWLSNFVEITEKELDEKLKVLSISSVTLNNNTGNLFIILTDKSDEPVEYKYQNS